MWLPVDGSDAPKIPSGKGKRLIVLHAGNREVGLIDRCDLVFLAKAKVGENQLMPALKSPSVMVLDNASYHNIKTEETLCQTLIREKLSYKIIFQNTTFVFSPLKN